MVFDLYQADINVYPKIHQDLREIDFSKLVPGHKHIKSGLPANSFLAEYEFDNFEQSSELLECGSDQTDVFQTFYQL